jgi:hypothetical protein
MSGRLANLFELKTPLDVGDAVRLFKDLSRESSSYVDTDSPSFIWLLQKINPKTLRSRQLTMLLHSFTGFLPRWTPDDGFLHHTCRAILSQLKDFDSMGLTQVVWSHAKMNRSIPPFLTIPLMAKIEETIKTFNPQDCSNCLWAFARQKHVIVPPQIQRVAVGLVTRASSMTFRIKSMEIANIFWSAGQLEIKIVANDCRNKLLSCVCRVAPMLTPQHIAMILHGASAIQFNQSTAQALQTQVENKISHFNPRCISNCLEGTKYFQLNIERKEQQQQSASTRSCIINIVHILLNKSNQIIQDFDCRDITSIVSFLEYIQNEQINLINVSTELKRIVKNRYIETCSEAQPIDLSRSLRSLVTSKVDINLDDITAVQTRLNVIVGEMDVISICHMLWSHAIGNWCLPRKLGRRIMSRCIDVIQEFTAQGISTVVWSLAKMYEGKILPSFIEVLENVCSNND